jgi:hypothetical protein
MSIRSAGKSYAIGVTLRPRCADMGDHETTHAQLTAIKGNFSGVTYLKWPVILD